MKSISLSQGFVALVDDSDYAHLTRWKWHAVRRPRSVYAQRQIRTESGRQKSVSMHAALMKPKPGEEVDRKNGNGLDNRRQNLRCCRPAENTQNYRKPITNTSGFKGVSKCGRKWKVEISARKQHFYLGVFTDLITAARAYDSAAKRLHGQFACLNFL